MMADEDGSMALNGHIENGDGEVVESEEEGEGEDIAVSDPEQDSSEEEDDEDEDELRKVNFMRSQCGEVKLKGSV